MKRGGGIFATLPVPKSLSPSRNCNSALEGLCPRSLLSQNKTLTLSLPVVHWDRRHLIRKKHRLDPGRFQSSHPGCFCPLRPSTHHQPEMSIQFSTMQSADISVPPFENSHYRSIPLPDFLSFLFSSLFDRVLCCTSTFIAIDLHIGQAPFTVFISDPDPIAF